MDQPINRRSFIKTAAAMGAATVVGGGMIDDLLAGTIDSTPAAGMADIAVVTGADYFASTIKAVELVGGIKRFVSKGSRVAILPNAVCKYPGTNVKPEIVLAVVKMCNDAGAREVCSLKETAEGYWRRAAEDKMLSTHLDTLKFSSQKFVTVPIPRGKKLKTADIVKDLLEYDLYITIAITKPNAGLGFTGGLKNLMGASAYEPTNRFCHFGSGSKGWYDDPNHLSQCIADLNLIRKPDLCLTDATEFITTNGPFGPGKIASPHKVVAGVDVVAVDSYCSAFLGLTGPEIEMIKQAYNHGLGKMAIDTLKISEVTI